MSRTLSVAALAKIAEKTGTEPINFIEIDWVDGTSIKYADKKLDGIDGLIMSLSSLDEVIQLSEGMSTAQVSVVLSDVDGTIKALIDEYDVHKRPVRVYQYFDGMDIDDAFELFRGIIVSPITWSEGDRTVSFDVISKIRAYQVGFSPDQGQYNFVQYDLAGNIWPLCFGSPIHVPAVKSNQIKTGSLMSTIGLPDATLPLKRDLLVYRLNQITNAYDQYQQLIAQASLIARPAYVVQKDYAATIIAEDNLKQVLEDSTNAIDQFNFKIDKLIKQHGDAFDSGADDQATIKDKLQDYVELRDKCIESIKNLNIQLENLSRHKAGLEAEVKNIKYEITVVNKLRKRCRDLQQQWLTFYREWTNVVEIINTQTLMGAQQTSVMNGNIFPQLTPTMLDVAGVTFSGVFDGYDLALSAPQPTYRNIAVAARESADISTFWISDSTLDLQGKYLRLSNQRIVKVTQQDGNKCIIDLPPKKKKKRTEKRDVTYEQNGEEFEDVLNRMLQGNETQEEIAKLVSQIPTKINENIMEMLRGPKRTFIVRVSKMFAPESTFRIAYGPDQITTPIRLDATVSDIRDALDDTLVGLNYLGYDIEITEQFPNGATKTLALTPQADSQFLDLRIVDFKPAPVNTGSEVGPASMIGAYESGADLGFKTLTFEFKTPTDWAAKQPNVTLSSGNTYKIEEVIVYGTLHVFINGIHLPYTLGEGAVITAEAIKADAVAQGAFPVDSTALEIEGQINCEHAFFTANTSTLTFTFNTDNNSVFIYPDYYLNGYDSDFSATIPIVSNSQNDNSTPKNINTLKTKFYFEINYQGDFYAQEYTTKQRAKLLEDDIDKNIDSPSIGVFKDKLSKLLKSKKDNQFNVANGDAEPLNAAAELEQEQSIQSAAAAYAEAIKQANVGDGNVDKAYELISKEEYKVLYDLELTGFLEWRNNFQELDQEFTEEDQYEFTALDITGTILEASPYILPDWVTWINGLDTYEKAFETELLPNNTRAFIGQIGDKVALQGLFQEKFVCNILPSTIISVYAYKNNAGLRQFVPVPTAYYVKNEAESYGYFTCTTITLAKPLSQIDPTWEDQIYVTLESSVGPNVADIISWIATHYTDLTVDATSFAHVNTLQTNYPANFALLGKIDALQLIREIAFQSRCSVWTKLGKLYIKYLPEEPTPVNTITEDNIEDRSFELAFTPSEEIVTKLTGRWKPHYAVTSDWQIVVRRNLVKYGEYPEERDFYIYNSYDLVYKSITWWLIMWANTFKIARFRVFLDQLNLETQDCILLDLGNNPFANTDIKGIIRKADYDSNSKSIQLEVWLPVLAGEMTQYTFAWLSDLSVTEIWPPFDDITAGNAGNPVNQNIPTGTEYDPVNDNDFNLRPRDMGKPDISDLNDSLPKNPANSFYELNYKLQANEEVVISEDTEAEKQKDSLGFDDIADRELSPVDSKKQDVLVGRIIDYYDSEEFEDVTVFGQIVSDGQTATIHVAKVLLETGGTIKAYLRQYGEENNNNKYPHETRVLVLRNPMMNNWEIMPLTYLNPDADVAMGVA